MISPFSGKEPHPVLELLSSAQIARLGEKKAAEYFKFRSEALAMEALDPLRYGFEPEVWAEADRQIQELRAKYPVGVIELLVLGGNRGSKTQYAGKTAVKVLTSKNNARCWALQSVEAVSRSDQQPLIYNHIPFEWRPEKQLRGKSTKIVYTKAGGFTENTFVLQNGSQCWFKFYGANVKTLESAELDFAWADELITPDWIEAIRFRLINRNGLLLVTFTPVEGYSATVKEYLNGATVLQESDAPLLPVKDQDGTTLRLEKVPRVMQCRNPKARVVYFHTADNPFGNYEAMRIELEDSPRERILMRAYGVPVKASFAQFPRFDPRVHVIGLNAWEEIKKTTLTRYLFLDPCGSRNWFMQWHAIDVAGRTFVYREWPSYGHKESYIPGVGELGEWTIPGKPDDGVRGPAQQEMGWALLRYKEEIDRLERDDGAIFERWIDARYANLPTVTSERVTSLIGQLDEIGLEFLAAPGEYEIGESNRNRKTDSIRTINDALYFDRDKPIDHFNQPKLYILETCPNTIYSMQEWTNQDGQHGACKDPVDCVRMRYLAGVEFCGQEMLMARRPWNAQFK